MNPFGVSGNLFATQANQSANGFMNPISPAYMSGGWGMDPSQMTPSYDAPYRPRFNGPSPYAAYQKPGFFGALGNTLNPFVKDPYWGSQVSHSDADATALGSNPVDYMARVGQRFVAPAIAFGLAQKIMTGSYGLTGLGGSGGWAGGVGRSFGSSLGRGLGMGSMGAGMMGGAGALAGSIALPMAVGYAVTSAIDHAIFQPYARMRQITEDLRSNFSGVTFSDARGDHITGRGLDRMEAGRMSSQIDSAGIKDMTWSASQFGAIANMSGRSGLLDGSNSKQIVNTIKGISEQIKMIVSISKDPSIQGAIEELAKLRLGGASIVGGAGSEAASVYRQLGIQASIAGTSVQQMMSTVGNQGQYMYQMNGLTPVLGQISAATTYAGFAAARRNGLFSDAQFARMGGEAGATQSVEAANLAALQTPYSKMMQANKYMFNGRGESGVVDTVSNFGANAASDPLKTMGGLMLYQGAMASAQKKEGWGDKLEQAKSILRDLGVKPGPNGYSMDQIAAVWGKYMNLTPDQISAGASDIARGADPATMASMMKSIESQTADQLINLTSQGSLGTNWIHKANRRGKQVAYNTLDDIKNDWSVPARAVADTFSTLADGFIKYTRFGNPLPEGTSSQNFEDALGQIGEGGSMDTLQVLKEADKLRSYYAANPGEDYAGTLGEKLKGSEYAALRKSLGGMGADQAWKKIQDLTNKGLATGLTGTASIYRKGMSADDLSKALGGKMIGRSYTPGSNPSSEEYLQISKTITDESRAKADLVSRSNPGVDTNEYTRRMKAYDSLESAAKHIDSAAGKMEGKSDPTKATSSGPNAFQKWMYGEKDKQNPVGK